MLTLVSRVTVWDSLTGQPLTTCSRGTSSPPPSPPPPPPPPQPTRGPRNRHSSAFRKFTSLTNLEDEPAPLVEDGPSLAAIWAVDLAEDLIVLGCDSGRVEVWDALTGAFRCQHDDSGGSGAVCHIRLVAGRLVVARLDGQLDFFELVGPYFHNLLTSEQVSNPVQPTPLRARPLSATSTDSLASWGEVRLFHLAT